MKKVADYAVIFLGLAMVAFAVSTLIVPNKIIQGGVSGLSAIVYYVTSIPVSVTNFVVNAVLIILGIRILGKKFIVNTLACVFVLSLLMEVFSWLPPVTNDRMLATVFGGTLYGMGIGLTLLKGASSGGTDIVGRIMQYFMPHLSIGKLLLVVDGLIILIGYTVIRDINLVLYGVATVFISTFSIDYLIKKLNISKIAFVITDKGDEIIHRLISTSGRGITKFNVVGAYTDEQKVMLMCAIKEREMPEFQQKIEEVDANAFTIFSESQQIVGNGFHVYR